MKVVLVIPNLLVGGAQTAILNVAHFLNQYVEVELVVLKSFQSEGLEPEGLNVTYLKVNRWFRVFGLRKLIISQNYSHAISFLTDANIILLLASVGTGLNVIVSERTFPGKHRINFLFRLLRRIFYPFADKLVVQTELTRDWFSDVMPGLDVRVIPNILDRSFLEIGLQRLYQTSFISKRIICVGRLSREKRFDLVIKAFANIPLKLRSDWKLSFVGDGDQRNELKNLCQLLGTANAVEFLGQLKDVSKIYEISDVFVLASDYEGFPNALLEAMGAGLCCIARNCYVGPSEIIDSSDVGFLLDYDLFVDELTYTLIDVINNPELLMSKGSNAQRRAEEFAPEKLGFEWCKILGMEHNDATYYL